MMVQPTPENVLLNKLLISGNWYIFERNFHIITMFNIAVEKLALLFFFMIFRSCRSRGISLHKFPSNTADRKRWARMFNMTRIPKHAFACSVHFTNDDYWPSNLEFVFYSLLA